MRAHRGSTSVGNSNQASIPRRQMAQSAIYKLVGVTLAIFNIWIGLSAVADVPLPGLIDRLSLALQVALVIWLLPLALDRLRPMT